MRNTWPLAFAGLLLAAALTVIQLSRRGAARGKILGYSLGRGDEMLSNRVRAQIEGIAGPLALVTVPLGDTVRASIEWRNVGASGSRDLIAIYGVYDPGSDWVITHFYRVVSGVYLAAGAQTITDVDAVCDSIGTKDAMLAVGEWHPEMGEFVVDDKRIILDALVVEEVPMAPVGQIVGYSFGQP